MLWQSRLKKKTNAMRELERAGQPYIAHSFECPEAISGVEVAEVLEEDPDCVFKTLVTVGKSGEHYVFMIPVAMELDLKKAAGAVGEKICPHGQIKGVARSYGLRSWGMFTIGDEELFTTTVDETAALYDRIYFSGGRIGCQIETSLDSLKAAIPVKEADITA